MKERADDRRNASRGTQRSAKKMSAAIDETDVAERRSIWASAKCARRAAVPRPGDVSSLAWLAEAGALRELSRRDPAEAEWDIAARARGIETWLAENPYAESGSASSGGIRERGSGGGRLRARLHPGAHVLVALCDACGSDDAKAVALIAGRGAEGGGGDADARERFSAACRALLVSYCASPAAPDAATAYAACASAAAVDGAAAAALRSAGRDLSALDGSLWSAASCAAMMRVAGALGSTLTMAALAAEPFRCSVAEALEPACACGRADVLRALQEPPLRGAWMRWSAAGAPDAAPPGASESSPFGRDRARAGRCLALACEGGHVDAIRALALLPFSVTRAECPSALWRACCGGSAAAVRELARAPLSFGRGDAGRNSAAAMSAACARGDAEIVALLAEPPYMLGRDDAVAADAMRCSCESRGAAELVSGPLAGSPFCLCGGDARACDALLIACRGGRADLVRALARPPYMLARPDALACGALRAACESGSADVVALLALEPYGLGEADALARLRTDGSRGASGGVLYQRVAAASQPSPLPDCLEIACGLGNESVVLALAREPYAAAPAARFDSGLALRAACAAGNAGAVAALARGPFCLGRAEAASFGGDALATASAGGHSAVVAMLGAEPYLAGADGTPESARRCAEALDVARRFGRTEVAAILSKPPFAP